MKRAWRMAALAIAVAAFAACGGEGGSTQSKEIQVNYEGKTTQSEVSQATVADAMGSANLFFPNCTVTQNPAKVPVSR